MAHLILTSVGTGATTLRGCHLVTCISVKHRTEACVSQGPRRSALFQMLCLHPSVTRYITRYITRPLSRVSLDVQSDAT